MWLAVPPHPSKPIEEHVLLPASGSATVSTAAPSWWNVGNAVHASRRSLRMSQAELAEAAGISRRTVNNYEMGRVSGPGIPAGLVRVVAHLGWPEGRLDELLGMPALERTPADAYRAVTDFADACVTAGADSRVRDIFLQMAHLLLEQAGVRVPVADARGVADHPDEPASEPDIQ
ncbi:helix-turn-helix transcriptional regulator [Kitasatospora sp. NPDC058048]|uniref:helix-turn-helix transcriptional regulator n=1 Tax=Kitasatospora sp. NPDC058048 TaxID=3346313 RepID=UPI0036DEA7EF